jgi:hypothetical protein
MQTTLKKIRLSYPFPFPFEWKKLLRGLGKTKADEDPLDLYKVLEINGFDFALRCLRGVDGHDKEIRLFAVWCAKQVFNLMKDQRSVQALRIARIFAMGKYTDEHLCAARNMSLEAVRRSAFLSTAEFIAAEAAASATMPNAWEAALNAAENSLQASEFNSPEAERLATRISVKNSQEEQFKILISKA